MPLKAGDMAPDFELRAVTGEREHTVKLSDYRGKQSVLVTFHPGLDSDLSSAAAGARLVPREVRRA